MADDNKWEKVAIDEDVFAEDTKPGLKYWDDVWRRFKGNPMSIIGLIGLVIIFSFAIFGPMFSHNTYSDQFNGLENTPPRLELYQISDDVYVYVHKEFKLLAATAEGELLHQIPVVKDDPIKRQKTFDVDGTEVVIDYNLAITNKNSAYAQKYQLSVDGVEKAYPGDKTVHNKLFFLGSDNSGRDVWIRILYGARISIIVGVAAALVNMIIGVLYGGISGYFGGNVDNVMMRIVDVVQSIPLLLIVIILMVVLNKSGLGTIIFALGLVYWVSMARQVRGQVITLKQQEFVLAANALGASSPRIILKHLIPNALGPIVVSMTMSIPQAIFTESFLSFVGLGVSAPQASWGTMANVAIAGIRSYPYLIIAPSIAIALTMFAFNFVGDGLRDALDPKLRK